MELEVASYEREGVGKLVQDRLEDSVSSAQPVGTGNIDLAGEVVRKCEVTRNRDAQELANILKNPHFKVKCYE
ncbi:hypothetical protein ANN_20021 [Periplaneta americana]|uniref:Uncharacterized protein n=1 Tax=Periplaneta americana TaxID=6978 RepID=A0ABQ8SBH6_PERAM|nr:hypothetical protein ANN_20021 [Periplaneta americana]